MPEENSMMISEIQARYDHANTIPKTIDVVADRMDDYSANNQYQVFNNSAM